MKTVTLRFYVASITEHAGSHHSIVMQPSYAHGANSDWSKYTPSGKIEINLSTEASVEFYTEALRNKSTIGITMEVVEDQ
jgi:hypothetical protein